jgi:microcompartment protein CcmK/EutM
LKVPGGRRLRRPDRGSRADAQSHAEVRLLERIAVGYDRIDAGTGDDVVKMFRGQARRTQDQTAGDAIELSTSAVVS